MGNNDRKGNPRLTSRLSRYVATGVLACLAQCGWGAPAIGAVKPANVCVTDCGAKGDGKADDTAAFEAAIKQATRSAKSVYVPMGTYKLTRPLSYEKIVLAGPEGGAWCGDIDTLPILAPAHRDGPCMVLRAGAGLRGICIRYDWAKEPEAGPAAVVVKGIGVAISNLKIQYAWDGIMADGESNVGRLNIENVFMVAIRNIGVRVTGTWDAPMLRNIEVWNMGPVPRGLAHGIGFDLGKNDLIRLTDCFAFAMQIGFLLRDEIPGCKIKGGTWGIMSGCSSDYCGRGIEVRGENTVSITGGTFWDHGEGLVVDGEGARVRLSGAELKSNGSPAVVVRRCAHVVISGCGLLRTMKPFTAPAVVLEGGATVLSGCQIEAEGNCITIGPDVQSLVAQGNNLDAHGNPAVVDKHGPKAKIRIDAEP